jgi:hypothetical protein
MTNPTARSKRTLEAEGYTVANVEKWIPQTMQRIDAFGFIDLIAIHGGSINMDLRTVYEYAPHILAVQSTTGTNLAARLAKILAEERALTWLRAGGLIVIHGWSKKGGAGKRKLWECRERFVTQDDFMSV